MKRIILIAWAGLAPLIVSCASVYEHNVKDVPPGQRVKLVNTSQKSTVELAIIRIDGADTGNDVVGFVVPARKGIMADTIVLAPGVHELEYVTAIPRDMASYLVSGNPYPKIGLTGKVKHEFRSGKTYSMFLYDMDIFGISRGTLSITEDRGR